MRVRHISISTIYDIVILVREANLEKYIYIYKLLQQSYLNIFKEE
jgi:hypothetical protein